MTNDLIAKFTDWAKKNDWTLERTENLMELPEEVIARYKNIPTQWLEFIINFINIMNSTDDMWFLTCANFLNDGWSYNDFEKMSLEAASSDEEWYSEIKGFWDNTFPIILSVGGDYQYYAIDLGSGNVVQGWEPEFEETSIVAETFVEFIEKLVAGEIELMVC